MLALLVEMLESPGAPIVMPGAPAARREVLSASDPATLALADFRASPVFTTPVGTTITAALLQMKRAGTRFAFVDDADGWLVGAVTAYDIRGEKPLRYMLSIGCTENTCAWSDVLVENIMEPVRDWKVIDHQVLDRRTIGDIYSLMTGCDRRYLVVVESASGGRERRLRGLFSAARIEQLLGVDTPYARSPAAEEFAGAA
jgi:CBS domain-containing protein